MSDWSHVTFRVICSKLFLFRDFGFVAVTRVRYSIDDDDIYGTFVVVVVSQRRSGDVACGCWDTWRYCVFEYLK